MKALHLFLLLLALLSLGDVSVVAAMEMCPVCGMAVDETSPKYLLNNGQAVLCCSEGHVDTFASAPVYYSHAPLLGS